MTNTSVSPPQQHVARGVGRRTLVLMVATVLTIGGVGWGPAQVHAQALDAGSAGTVVGRPPCNPPGAGQPWPTAKPADVGLDAVKLQKAIDFATTRQSATFQVFRSGCLVGSSALDPVYGGVKRNMWSHTKTVTALVVGRAVTLGYLRLDDTVGKFFPEADAAHAAITVRHLLTMTSGLHMEWSTEMNPLIVDRVKLALSLPVEHRPGTYFEYHQTAPTLLTALVQRAVGRDFQQFAQDELFTPIGIERDSWFWLRDRAGNTEGWAYLFTEPNSHLARIGALMLRGGVWNGRRLIDGSYMEELRTPSAANPGYGFLTWLNAGERYINAGFPARRLREHRIIESAPNDLYFSWGFHGEHAFVIPSLDMVVTRTHQYYDWGSPDLQPDMRSIGGEWGEGYHELFRLLMAAVTDRQMPDPGPWNQPLDHGFDSTLYLSNPLFALGAAGVGPNAPAGCSPTGCTGAGNDGSKRNLEDLVATSVPSAAPHPEAIADLVGMLRRPHVP